MTMVPAEGGSGTLAAMYMKVDPKLPSPPEWLVSFVLGQMAPWMFGAMSRMLATFPKDDATLPPERANAKGERAGLRYARRIRANQALYSLVASRIQARVKRRGVS